jgi:hypothetical protein
MQAETLSDPAVEEFAGLVRRLNNVVGSLDTMAEAEMLMAMDELLPHIYGAAHRLPDIYGDDDDDDEEEQVPAPVILRTLEERTGWWKDLREKFGGKLGWHRVPRFMYDPFPGARHDEHEVMGADLADILADACLDLAEGLELYEMGDIRDPEQAVFEWRLGLQSGWGHCVAEAMLPIHLLLHKHYNEDDVRFDI